MVIFYLSQTLKIFLFQRFGSNMLYQRLIRQSTITGLVFNRNNKVLYQRLIRQSTITGAAPPLTEKKLYQRLIRQSTITYPQ